MKNVIKLVGLTITGIIFIASLVDFKNPIQGQNEIEDNSFVMAVGIDKGNQGKYRLTLLSEKFSVEGSGTDQSGAVPSKVAEIVSAEGETLFDATRNFKEFKKKRVFWGHIKYVIISEELARENILDALDFIIRDHESRLTMSVMIAKGLKAEDIIRVEKDGKDFVPDIIDNLFMNASGLSISSNVKLTKLMIMLDSKYADAYLPSIVLKKDIDSDGKEKMRIFLTGYALFNGPNLVDFVEEKDARGFNWVINKIVSAIITVKDDTGQDVSLEIITADTKINSKFEKEKPKVTIEINFSSNVGEQQSLEDIYNEKTLLKIEQQQSEIVKKEVEKIIKLAQKEKIDIFGLSDEIYHKNPLKWDKIKNNWQKIFSEMAIEVNVKSAVKRVYIVKEPISSKNGDQ